MFIYTEPDMVKVGDQLTIEVKKGREIVSIHAVMTVKSVNPSVHHTMSKMEEVEIG